MFSATWNLKSDGLSIISLVTAAGSLACGSGSCAIILYVLKVL